MVMWVIEYVGKGGNSGNVGNTGDVDKRADLCENYGEKMHV